MPSILGVPFTDEQARNFNAQDANGRAQILAFIGRSDLIPASNKAWVEESFGYLGEILKYPEIWGILNKAASEGWSEARIQGAITASQFWKTHSASQRNFIQLAGSDKAELDKQIAAMRTQIETTASTLGVAIPEARLAYLARQFLYNGVTPERIQGMVAAEARYNPGGMVGGFGSTMNDVKATANKFLVPLSDAAAFTRSKAILQGKDTLQGTEAYFRNVAKARWSHLEEDLDRGYTVRDLIDPNVQQAAQLLGIDPDAIDFSDPKWQRVIDTVGDDNKHRIQTLDETARMVRGQAEFGWQGTDQARALAASRVEGLAQRLGAVA